LFRICRLLVFFVFLFFVFLFLFLGLLAFLVFLDRLSLQIFESDLDLGFLRIAAINDYYYGWIDAPDVSLTTPQRACRLAQNDSDGEQTC